jgi:hypothetical protein
MVRHFEKIDAEGAHRGLPRFWRKNVGTALHAAALPEASPARGGILRCYCSRCGSRAQVERGACRKNDGKRSEKRRGFRPYFVVERRGVSDIIMIYFFE